jgi:hypothetical protein
MNWFKRRGYLFVPNSTTGWVIFSGVVAYLVFAFLKIYNRSHLVSDTLMNWSFHVLIAGIIYTGIAYFMSPKKN